MTQGFLDQWLICGEFFSDRGWSTLDEDYLFGEGKIVPKKGIKSFGRPWIEYNTTDNRMEFLLAPFKHTLFVAGYAHTYVYSPKDTSAVLLTGSDDGIKVWLNREVVLRTDLNRACKAGDDKADINLKAGWNSFMVKVRQGMAQWQFYAQIQDKDGNEIPGLYCAHEADYPAAPIPEKAIGVRVRWAVETYEFRNGGFFRDVQFEVGNIGSKQCDNITVEVPGAEIASVGTLASGETKIVTLRLPFASMVSVMRQTFNVRSDGQQVKATITLGESSRLLRNLFAPFFIPNGIQAQIPSNLSGFTWSQFTADSKGVYMLIDPQGLRDYLGRIVGAFPMQDKDTEQARLACDDLLKRALANDKDGFIQALNSVKLPEIIEVA